ncbi:replication protein [Gracilibacillus xinjiangensis]|uniref:Replication protein n=1 Tax=Gracilibacillus xinjiangensis TaxID=1193282 RepID=A0ABV8WV11_9BACI
MANPQVEEGYIRIANDLWNEVLRRNFSKRQLNIIYFIWRLSYGTGQKACTIPTLKKFELAGIHKQDIRKELRFLTECAVLDWNEVTMVFAINKDYHQWQITPHTNWDADQFNDLIAVNIKRKSSAEPAKKVRKLRTPINSKARNIRTDRQEKVSNPRIGTFVKHVSQNSRNPVIAKDSASVKTSLKTVKKKDIKEYNNNNARFHEVMNFYRNNLQKGSTDSPFNSELLRQWYDEFGDELLLAAMKVAAKREAKGVNYIESVLYNWKDAGITTIEAARQYEKQFHSKKQKTQQRSSRENIVPDWYADYRKEHIQKKLEPTQEEKDILAAKSDRMLAEYLANQG